MKLCNSDTEVASALSNLSVCLPSEVAPGLGGSIVGSLTQTSLACVLLCRVLEDIVCGAESWINSGQEWLVDHAPVTVDSRAALLLRAWDWDGIWTDVRWWSAEGLDVGINVVGNAERHFLNDEGYLGYRWTLLFYTRRKSGGDKSPGQLRLKQECL